VLLQAVSSPEAKSLERQQRRPDKMQLLNKLCDTSYYEAQLLVLCCSDIALDKAMRTVSKVRSDGSLAAPTRTRGAFLSEMLCVKRRTYLL
jgi:hypothetical protein